MFRSRGLRVRVFFLFIIFLSMFTRDKELIRDQIDVAFD